MKKVNLAVLPLAGLCFFTESCGPEKKGKVVSTKKTENPNEPGASDAGDGEGHQGDEGARPGACACAGCCVGP